MLLIYRLADGEVVDNSGTSSAFPDGPPDELAYVNTDAAGLDRATLGLLRINDTDPQVGQILVQRHKVDPASGKVVLLGAYDAAPAPAPAPADPDVALEERIAGASNLDQLKAALLGSGSTVAVAARSKES